MLVINGVPLSLVKFGPRISVCNVFSPILLGSLVLVERLMLYHSSGSRGLSPSIFGTLLGMLVRALRCQEGSCTNSVTSFQLFISLQ